MHSKATQLSHSRDVQTEGHAPTECIRHRLQMTLAVDGRSEEVLGAQRGILSDNSKQQTQAAKACRKLKVKPTGNSEPKSALKSLLSTSSKILVVPESMPICSIIL